MKRKTVRYLSLGVLTTLIAITAIVFIAHRVRYATALNFTRLPFNAFYIEENKNHPDLSSFRKEENLDEIIASHKTDLAQMMALMKWTREQFEPGNPLPNYPPWNARNILRMIREEKTEGFCAQYSIVFGQACQSFGYSIRYLDLFRKDMKGSHFVTEVFIPSLKKWVVFDVLNNLVYQNKKGEPLNALEVREANLSKQPLFSFKDKKSVKEESKFFYFLQYYLRNNYLSWPVHLKLIPFKNESQGRFSGKFYWLFDPYKALYVDSKMTKENQQRFDASFHVKSSESINFRFKTAYPNPIRFNIYLSQIERVPLHESVSVLMTKKEIAVFFEGMYKLYQDFQQIKQEGSALRVYQQHKEKYSHQQNSSN